MPGRRSSSWMTIPGGLFCLAFMAMLWWAKPVLIPVALSVLLTFLLAPIVTRIERLGVGRVIAVLAVVVLVFTAIFGGGYIVAIQMTGLGDYLQQPEHQANFKAKTTTFLSWTARNVEYLRRTVEKTAEEEVEKAAGPAEPAANDPASPGQGPRPAKPDPLSPDGPTSDAGTAKPVHVILHDESLSGADIVRSALANLGEPVATGGLVVALVIFMLVQREDLRNRLIRLIGAGRLTMTTRALDEVAERISRYLLAQTVVNGTFGVGVGVGLFLIGVPYALLWGFLAAILRFIPYVGPLVAAFFPLAFSLFVFEGWSRPLVAAGFYAALELVSNMVMEPLLYGKSAGVSTVALLVAIAFWTWIWGPIGLLLATPLTVCIAVLGRNVPQLEFLGIVLGDQPVLEPSTTYYQRLLAGDQDEAMEIVEERAKKASTIEICDEILIPALVSARRDLMAERIDKEDESFIHETTRYALEELAGRDLSAAEGGKKAKGEEGVLPAPAAAGPPIKVLACPARGKADELALDMLGHALQGTRVRYQTVSSKLLASEMVTLCAREEPDVVCVAALAPGGLAQARYLIKRLKAELSAPRVCVGRWGLPAGGERSRDALAAAGAERIGMTLAETREEILGPLAVRNAAAAADR